MARRTFFSFHYAPDVHRAWNVRNSWTFQSKEKIDQGFFDSSVFEASRRENEDTLKAFLRKGLENTSVTCVLAGSETWTRRWVRYEIARSIVKGNGLLTVGIHGVKNLAGAISEKGSNPLDNMAVYNSNGSIYLAEWKNGQWVKYADYQSAIPVGDLWFDAPKTAGVVQLSTHCMTYDFAAQNGAKDIGGWIETAAGMAGR